MIIDDKELGNIKVNKFHAYFDLFLLSLFIFQKIIYEYKVLSVNCINI